MRQSISVLERQALPPSPQIAATTADAHRCIGSRRAGRGPCRREKVNTSIANQQTTDEQEVAALSVHASMPRSDERSADSGAVVGAALTWHPEASRVKVTYCQDVNPVKRLDARDGSVAATPKYSPTEQP
jgi:hypothetical protein